MTDPTHITVLVPCGNCRATGIVWVVTISHSGYWKECQVCDGRGVVKREVDPKENGGLKKREKVYGEF